MSETKIPVYRAKITFVIEGTGSRKACERGLRSWAAEQLAMFKLIGGKATYEVVEIEEVK